MDVERVSVEHFLQQNYFMFLSPEMHRFAKQHMEHTKGRTVALKEMIGIDLILDHNIEDPKYTPFFLHWARRIRQYPFDITKMGEYRQYLDNIVQPTLVEFSNLYFWSPVEEHIPEYG